MTRLKLCPWHFEKGDREGVAIKFLKEIVEEHRRGGIRDFADGMDVSRIRNRVLLKICVLGTVTKCG